jgi:hypothetical protein
MSRVCCDLTGSLILSIRITADDGRSPDNAEESAVQPHIATASTDTERGDTRWPGHIAWGMRSRHRWGQVERVRHTDTSSAVPTNMAHYSLGGIRLPDLLPGLLVSCAFTPSNQPPQVLHARDSIAVQALRLTAIVPNPAEALGGLQLRLGMSSP